MTYTNIRRYKKKFQQKRIILISILTQWTAIQEQLTCNREQTFYPVTCVARNTSYCVHG